MRLAGVSLSQFLKIGLIALLFIVLFKYVASKVNVPGLSSVAAMA